MKIAKTIIATLLLAVVPVFAAVTVAQAQRFSSHIDEGQKVHGSLYSSGKEVKIKGEIFGDVFCAGQKVTVEATVHGDVICAGMDVTVNGKVLGDVRVAGQTVNVAAEVERSATLAGMQVSLDATAKVGQDLTITGNELNIKGAVQRDVVASGSMITFNGPVGRNATAQSDRIDLKKDARITGNLTYTGGREPKLADGATVAGETRQNKSTERHAGPSISPLFYLIALLGTLLIVALMVLCFPRFLQRTKEHIAKRPTRTLLIGAVASLLWPLLIVGLAFTVAGIPLAAILLLAGLLAAVLTMPIVAYFTGQLIMRASKNAIAVASVGTVVVVTASFVPFIGAIVLTGVYWFGLGALLTELYGHSRFGNVPAKRAAKES